MILKFKTKRGKKERKGKYNVLANARSLMNGKPYTWIFPIKPEVDFKRLSSPTFGTIEPENVLNLKIS